MLTDPIRTLEAYVNQPSGSHDRDDVAAMAAMIAADFASLGFAVERHAFDATGPALVCRIGRGPKQLMLMGHMDTVFPHDVAVPFTDNGDGTASGSGIIDMKGGIVVMLYALNQALPQLDLNQVRLCAVINPDEEIGSPSSAALLLRIAQESFAALSFELAGDGRLTCARKGVTDVTIACKGIPGHAGAQYTRCASAIQALCAQITRLYTLRDDEKEISFNAGVMTGGTAENVVAAEAACRCEFRYFDQSLKAQLSEQILALCAQEPVPGVTTSVTFGASHPAIDLNERSQPLLSAALAIAKSQGRTLRHERTGGAGDIAIVGQAGIGVLDGLGLQGEKMHTVQERANIALIPQQIDLAARLMVQLLG